MKSTLLFLLSVAVAVARFGPHVRIDHQNQPNYDCYECSITIGPGASFVCGLRPYSYLIAGEQGGYPTHDFYAIEPKHIKHPHGGGSQAGDIHSGSVRAQVIPHFDRIEVEYQLPAAARVRAILHDAVGRQVGALDAGDQQPGTHRLSWNRNGEGDKLSSGAYFLLLDMGKEQVRLKAVVR